MIVFCRNFSGLDLERNLLYLRLLLVGLKKETYENGIRNCCSSFSEKQQSWKIHAAETYSNSKPSSEPS